MRLVVDAGPLIALSKTSHHDLLPHFFDEVVIPTEVLDDIAKPGDTRAGCFVCTRVASPSPVPMSKAFWSFETDRTHT